MKMAQIETICFSTSAADANGRCRGEMAGKDAAHALQKLRFGVIGKRQEG